MSGLRKAVLVSASLLAASPAISTGSIHYVFAACAGRFSAEMEHAWLMGDAEAQYFEDRRETFLSLMEATRTSGSSNAVLGYRIETKVAHASLLTLGAFGRDAKMAEMAKSAARTHRLGCEKLLLDS